MKAKKVLITLSLFLMIVMSMFNPINTVTKAEFSLRKLEAGESINGVNLYLVVSDFITDCTEVYVSLNCNGNLQAYIKYYKENDNLYVDYNLVENINTLQLDKNKIYETIALPLGYKIEVLSIVVDGITDKANNYVFIPARLSTPIITISENGFASWEEVANAKSYIYKINSGEEISTTALDIQLTDGQSITVKAVSNGSSYTNSLYATSTIFIAGAEELIEKEPEFFDTLGSGIKEWFEAKVKILTYVGIGFIILIIFLLCVKFIDWIKK